MATAHERGIVHRDIKPENLILRPDGFVKVLDFGLARDLAGKLSATVQSSSTMPAAGTLFYMAPEQLRGEAVTEASDIFSLGIVLYELAAGRHPFESDHPLETAAAMHTHEPPPLSAINPKLPASLDQLLASMLKRDPAQRPTARQLVDCLSASSEERSGRSNRAWHYGVGAVAVLALAAAIAVFFHDRSGMSGAAPALRIVPLTGEPAIEYQPALSYDGKQVVYARRDGNAKPFELYTKLIGGGPPLRLPTRGTDNFDPAWSRTGCGSLFCGVNRAALR